MPVTLSAIAFVSAPPGYRAQAPLVQVDDACVVDSDIGASKSSICAVRVVTISKRTGGRTRACNPRVGVEAAMANVGSAGCPATER